MGDRESLTSSQMFANTTIATPSLREGLTPLPIEVHDKVAILKNEFISATVRFEKKMKIMIFY